MNSLEPGQKAGKRRWRETVEVHHISPFYKCHCQIVAVLSAEISCIQGNVLFVVSFCHSLKSSVSNCKMRTLTNRVACCCGCLPFYSQPEIKKYQ